jgi:hypothetical protein
MPGRGLQDGRLAVYPDVEGIAKFIVMDEATPEPKASLAEAPS